jgi:6-pyruvoyltetrahydropterin/6-carboxytetrahydropterin synthase
MPYRICKSFLVESGHILSKHSGRCRFPHGHSRRIEVTLEAERLDANDMVCDFKQVKNGIANYIEQFDHAMCLNTLDPQYEYFRSHYERVIGFEGVDPTSEQMARRIFDEMAATLRRSAADASRGMRVVSVRVHETESSWAEYAV